MKEYRESWQVPGIFRGKKYDNSLAAVITDNALARNYRFGRKENAKNPKTGDGLDVAFFTLPFVSRGGDESPKNRRVTLVGRRE